MCNSAPFCPHMLGMAAGIALLLQLTLGRALYRVLGPVCQKKSNKTYCSGDRIFKKV